MSLKVSRECPNFDAFVHRPVLEGLCTLAELNNDVYDIDDLVTFHDMLDAKMMYEADAHAKAQEKK